jgi:hypothetical protein
MKAIKDWFSKQVNDEVEKYDTIPISERVVSFIIIVVVSLITLYFIFHQIRLTGFFTISFGIAEKIMLYGSLSAWFLTSALEGFGYKNLSRDFDAFGGIAFVVFGIIWLLVVFPFDFVYFPNVLPESLRVLVRWISDNVARGFMAIGIIVTMFIAIYSLILRISVRKKLKNQ